MLTEIGNLNNKRPYQLVTTIADTAEQQKLSELLCCQILNCFLHAVSVRRQLKRKGLGSLTYIFQDDLSRAFQRRLHPTCTIVFQSGERSNVSQLSWCREEPLYNWSNARKRRNRDVGLKTSQVGHVHWWAADAVQHSGMTGICPVLIHFHRAEHIL